MAEVQLDFIIDITMVMLVIGFTSVVLARIQYPSVIGYLIGGVLIGALGLVRNPDHVNFFADLGIIMLMFYLGLEFNLKRLRRIGMFALLAGTIEISIMMLIGYSLGQLMHWSHFESVFLGAVMSISSTALITKTLIDMGMLSRDHGETVVGMLIVEDFFVVVILTLISPMTADFTFDPWMILELIVRVLLFISIALSLGLMIVPRFMDRVCIRFSEETAIMVSLSLCFMMVLISLTIDLSVAIGAFIMGTIISQSRSVDFIASRVRPLATLFTAIFFVSMGMLIRPELLVDSIITGIILALVFMVGNTFAVTFATYVANRSAGSSLRAGLSMMAMGEFSIIISKVGMDSDLLSPSFYSAVLAATLITMVAYPFFISRMESIITTFKRMMPSRVRETIAALEEMRGGVRDRMSRSSMRARQIKNELSMIFVDLVIITVIIISANLVISIQEFITPLAELDTAFLSFLVLIFTLVLILPPVISIIRRLSSVMTLLTICTEEAGICKKRERKTIRALFIELNAVLIGILLIILLISIIPVFGNMSWPFILIAAGIASVVVFLLREIMQAAHRRFAHAIMEGFRGPEE